MARPLTRIAVHPDDVPILDALRRMHHDIGSVSVGSIGGYRDAIDPALHFEGARLLCVPLTDADEVDFFAQRLRGELSRLPSEARRRMMRLTDRVIVHPLPLDSVLVVFLDIPALELPDADDPGH